MSPFFTIIKSDYLQRTRSYAFLITLCTSLAIAYTFVPEPNANYSTIRIADHVGYYNSAWFGYVTAIMTSIFLSLVGFYLINSGIKKDIETKVGQIVASTSISNFKYLLAKMLSNFILLLTIVLVVFVMSIILFVFYDDGFPFELLQFVKAYVLITIPPMCFISALSVVFEVFLARYSIIQNIAFFFLFSALLIYTPKTESQFSLDVFGSKIVMCQLEETVRSITKSDEKMGLTNIGYVVGNLKQTKKFEFNGIDFPTSFVISRLIWIFLSIVSIAIVSIFFHRFNIKERISIKKFITITEKQHMTKEVVLSKLPIAQINYRILPLVKTEFLLLFRKGKKWLWIVNGIGMVLLVILPFKISHQIALPILWFLQVSRLSDLTTKEAANNVNYFAFTSYKPLRRLLFSQLLAGSILIVGLSLPLIIRYAILIDLNATFSILLGGLFIVLLASTMGIISKGKKLFDVLFFMITYANINGIPFVDYFGGISSTSLYAVKLLICIVILGVISFILRKIELQ
ncbi:ABC transporter permease [Winogradskyella sp. R77965]|uniref:ABC transporter permease n=1 Tax=Winogradskyella sp. R77965 TaxID=3093872 RepID=UPI0037DD318E